MADQAEIHRMVKSEDVDERREAAEQLSSYFSILPDKEQAWYDLNRLIQDNSSTVRRQAIIALGIAFSHIPEKEEGGEYLHRLTKNNSRDLQMVAIDAMISAFPYITDKKQAWDDLHRLSQDNSSDIRWRVADALGSAFSYIPNKIHAWAVLHRLIQDRHSGVRWGVTEAIGMAFPYIPDKDQAWKDLHRLTQDTDNDVGIYANYSLGKAYIFKATETQNEEDFRKELENAIEFFSSTKSAHPNPARFCLPFYRSFYTLTFKKEETEAEVQKYIAEAKSSVEGSESKEKLLEAVENLGTALKEAQKARDFSDVKADLNAYRRYCERACELLDTTKEKAPGASKLIRRGLPIIDERIKGIIAEIQEKARALCKQVKDTEFKEIGQQVNNVGQDLTKIRDPIGLEKGVNNMLTPLSAMCEKMPKKERGEASELLEKIKQEQYVEDKLPLINMLLSKFSTQMDQKNIYVSLEKSNYAQVSIGNGNYQVQSSNSRQEKD